MQMEQRKQISEKEEIMNMGISDHSPGLASGRGQRQNDYLTHHTTSCCTSLEKKKTEACGQKLAALVYTLKPDNCKIFSLRNLL